MKKTIHSEEIAKGRRFAFGQNWTNFLQTLDQDRIREAELSLKKMLDGESLAGKRFIDVGSGSGLFSLAARRLGARVHSFDYDPQSVSCTTELKRLFFPEDPDWTVEEGSVLDMEYLSALGQFDVVYSWGVLHHTGAMWQALANIDINVASGGKLFIALYNDQGPASQRWHKVKKLYNSLPRPMRPILSLIVYIPIELKSMLMCLVGRQAHLNLKSYFSGIINYKKNRGMSWWYDKIDWLGGFPFEVSRPEEIFEFYRSRGYQLVKLKTCAGGLGCNEYVFQKNLQTQ